jgi:hypothetical protein
MDEQKKQFKFPIGAIFLFIYASFLLCINFSIISSSFPVFLLISFLAIVGLGVVSIMKKRGLLILIPTVILTLNTLIQFSVSDIPYILMLACIILFSLDDMNIGSLSKFRKTAKTVFIIAVIVHAVLIIVFNIINVWTNPDKEFVNGWIEIINYILHPLSMLLIGLWIYDPFKSEKKNTYSNLTSDYYISLGKHICLLIFTFGIWQMIWVYKQTQFTNNAKGEEERNPTTKLLLYLFIPFYSIYWTYKTAQRIDIIAKDNGCNSDLSTVCLILAIFIGIIPPILMQDKVNEIIKKLSTKSEDV